MMCGGFGASTPADDQIKEIAKEVKPQAEAALGATYSTYEAISYKSQVVAGTNFTIKVKVDGDKYIHLKVFRPLPCNGTELKLTSQSAGHTLEEAL